MYPYSSPTASTVFAYEGIIAAAALKSTKAFLLLHHRAPEDPPSSPPEKVKTAAAATGSNPTTTSRSMCSTMFNSIFLSGGAESIATHRNNGRALHWVREAFAYLKAIGAVGEAVDFIRDACFLPGIGFSTSSDVVNSYGVVTAAQVKPESFREVLEMVEGATGFLDAYTYEISEHKNFEREVKGFPMMVAF